MIHRSQVSVDAGAMMFALSASTFGQALHKDKTGITLDTPGGLTRVAWKIQKYSEYGR
jgi:hypothetical protein